MGRARGRGGKGGADWGVPRDVRWDGVGIVGLDLYAELAHGFQEISRCQLTEQMIGEKLDQVKRN